MPKSIESPRSRLAVWQADRNARSESRGVIGFRAAGWAALSLIVILLVLIFLLAMDGATVARAAESAEKSWSTDRPWSSALAAKDWAGATKLIQAEVKKNPSDTVAQNELGRVLLQQGKIQEAEIALITAESLAPSVVDFKVSLADLYERKGRDSRGLAAGKLEEALNLDPARADLRWRLARHLYSLGEYDRSLEELRAINALEPDNWEAYRLTADVAMGRKKYQEAIDNLKLYTAIVPDGRGFTRLAQAYMSLQPPDTLNARRAAEVASRYNPNDPQAALILARINTVSLGEKGLSQAVVTKRADAALAHYQRAARYAMSARDWEIVSNVQGRARRNLPGAEVALWAASGIETTEVKYRSALGANLLQQQKYADAIEVFEAVVLDQPKNDGALVNLGQCYYRSGEPDKAIAAYEKALEINAANANAMKGLGDVYIDKGKPSDAIDAYRNATTANPKMGDAWEALGYALWQQKNFPGATEALLKALEIDSCNVRAIQTLALCYKELTRAAEALATARKGLSCDPGNSTLQQLVKSLGG